VSVVAVVGLGYVGLPLAREACSSGLRVAGLDVDPTVVAAVSSGSSRVDDVSDADLALMRQQGFRVTGDPSVIRELADGDGTVVMCVPTPLAEDGAPDLRAVLAATETVAEHVPPTLLLLRVSRRWVPAAGGR